MRSSSFSTRNFSASRWRRRALETDDAHERWLTCDDPPTAISGRCERDVSTPAASSAARRDDADRDRPDDCIVMGRAVAFVICCADAIAVSKARFSGGWPVMTAVRGRAAFNITSRELAERAELTERAERAVHPERAERAVAVRVERALTRAPIFPGGTSKDRRCRSPIIGCLFVFGVQNQTGACKPVKEHDGSLASAKMAARLAPPRP